MTGYLSQQQVDTLLRGIKPSRVLHLDGMSHLAAYDVRAHLNRVFGFGRWSADVLDVTQLYEHPTETKNKKPAFAVAYRATVRLSVCSPDGTPLATYTECAVGDSIMPDFKRGDCHDMAIKTAESQALKRCATNLGDQFGLSLYRNGSAEPVVTVTLVGQAENPEGQPDTPDVEEQAPDVVPEQEWPTVVVAGVSPTLDELLLDAQQANSSAALDALACRVRDAHNAKGLSDTEFSTLRDVVTARRAELTPSTPPAGADDDETARRRASHEGSAA